MRSGKFPVETFQIRYQKIPADRVTGSDMKLSSACADIEELAFAALDQADRRFDVAQKISPSVVRRTFLVLRMNKV